MAEEYGLKVWIELAAKNIKEIQKEVQEKLKNVPFKMIGEKGRMAGAAAERGGGAGGTAAGAATGSLGKLAMTAGAVLGILYFIKKGVDKMVSHLAKASPYLTGIFRLFGHAMMLFFRPFGDFLATLLRPLAISLLKLSVQWLKFTRTPEGAKVVEGISGAVTGAAIGAGVGAVVGGIIGGPGGALIGAGIGGALGAIVGTIIKLAPEIDKVIGTDFVNIINGIVGVFSSAFGVVKALFTGDFESFLSNLSDLGRYLLTYLLSLLKTSFALWVNLGKFMWNLVTFLIKTNIKILKGFGSWLWDKIKEPLGNIWDWLVGVAQWVWDKITGPLSNVHDKIKGFAQWVWDKITAPLGNIWDKLSGIGTFLWKTIKGAIKDSLGFLGDFIPGGSGGGQTGIRYVPHTGMYKLHQGEEVTTASRVERGHGSVVIQPTFNVYAGSGDSTSSIESTVRRAARLMELEMRARGLI